MPTARVVAVVVPHSACSGASMASRIRTVAANWAHCAGGEAYAEEEEEDKKREALEEEAVVVLIAAADGRRTPNARRVASS